MQTICMDNITARIIRSRTIARDLTVCLVSLVIIVSIISISLSYLNTSSRDEEQLKVKAQEYVYSLARSLKVSVWNLDITTIENICESFYQNELIVALKIVDSDGEVLFFHEKPNTGETIIRKEDIFYNNSRMGQVELALTSRYYKETNRKLLLNSISAVTIIIITLIGMTQFLLRIFLRHPLEVLMAGIDNVARGDYQYGFEEVKQKDIREIALRFSEMAKEIENREKALNKMNTDLSQSQAELKKYSSNLECMVKERTEKLEEALHHLKSTQSQLLQSEKMASIGQLAAGVAHEINNPMGFISSNLSTLRKYLGRITEFESVCSEIIKSCLGQEMMKLIMEKRREMKIDYIKEDAMDLINESIEGASRVKTIVQDLKSFSRIDAEQMQYANINECLDSTINIAWNELKYKAQIVKDYGELPQTKCNAQHINQVFMNILVNAAQAIEDQGIITIRTCSEDSNIHVLISDTGSGISPDKIGRIFEPFFTTKDVGKGTGLGLSIVYDILKKHNGDISVESVPGEGAVFRIRIPVIA